MAIQTDVLIVGGGNAALCAALAARAHGVSVMVLERAPEDERGGNSRFTEGSMRFAFNGVDDLLKVVPDLTEDEKQNTDFGAYTEDDFFDDLFRVTDFRSDPDLAEVLVRRSFDTVCWLRSLGLRYVPKYGKQAYKMGGRFKFSGGVVVEVVGGGAGLVDSLYKLVADRGVDVRYNARALSLLADDSGVHGVRARIDGKTQDIESHAVILACGGFEANAEWRARYLGPGWDLAKVRGSRFNTGDGLRMAIDAGALPVGNWSGCHVVAGDLNAPNYGDLKFGDAFQKHSYPFGVLVNAEGKRFFDEGYDFRMYTYVECGLALARQPKQLAYQVFDGKVLHLLRDEYRLRSVTKVRADTLEELAESLEGVNPQQFLATIREYNAAVRTDRAFDPNSKDGRCTEGLALNKSNWANTLDEGPFEAYPVTTGITFTFGGLKINARAEVEDVDARVIPGLYTAGEMVGGLFYSNYPGGSGLISGSVFGRVAGDAAAEYVRSR
ncbi:FAD-dependent tricarballylate dehydrogenase TcuA [Pigmentiphaga sp. H8]|uniref:FAD-dependent tricarballylate dehydrogenase TcuA n=1 Tax=unclassified Pigmentiphaga TaxID=2626614 RepID=UPI000F59B68B|nr:FAD-dependent tricarballylate dehydrogenase TcuA [Pigmentiphaga sp. H8]AZG10214.1 FAD-dependent tricarballylate dehydrogenase TcuA [Pigmentiphaga sp. H8]